MHLQQNIDCQCLVNDQAAQNETTASSISEFRELNPSEFDGRLDPMLAERWLIQIEKIFSVLDLTDE